MPPPIHVSAFQQFNEQIADHLEASIAFALFLQSERAWAQEQDAEPTEAKYRAFHASYLTNYQIGRYQDSARNLLAEYGTNIVATKKVEFLNEALTEFRNAAANGHRSFRGWGIGEAVIGAVGGAFIWTALLILIAIFLARGGIDIFEYYERAAGIPYHAKATPPQQPQTTPNQK